MKVATSLKSSAAALMKSLQMPVYSCSEQSIGEAWVAVYSHDELPACLPGGSSESWVEHTLEDMLEQREIRCCWGLRHLV